jgi:hypothetical protein
MMHQADVQVPGNSRLAGWDLFNHIPSLHVPYHAQQATRNEQEQRNVLEDITSSAAFFAVAPHYYRGHPILSYKLVAHKIKANYRQGSWVRIAAVT